jgi:hypothetical protein
MRSCPLLLCLEEMETEYVGLLKDLVLCTDSSKNGILALVG